MKTEKIMGISLLIAVALMFIPIPFINNQYIAGVIVLVNALMLLFK